jgi:transketolase
MEETGADDTATLRDLATRLRRHCIRMTSEAGSGHPTSCLSAADLVAALFGRVLCFNVSSPADPRNDRFVLSKGHAAPLLYAAWAEAGAIPVDSLLSLRRFDSDLEGHPTPRFPWTNVATGSLGQGLSAGLGMALAARERGLPYRVFVLLGDGETAEGAVWEAASLAPHLGLDNLTAIVDVNRLGQSQATQLEHDLEAYARRFVAFGWHTLPIDGHDFDDILRAFAEAQRVSSPSVILARTVKGKGVSFLEGAEDRHGKALDKGSEMEKALAELEPSRSAASDLQVRAPEGTPVGDNGRERRGEMALPDYELGDAVATRTAYGNALRKLGDADPRVMALDGDVKNSTRAAKFAEAYPERFVEGYIAEQNLAGMALGLQARGMIPFFATFACFLTRAFDFIRVAAISRANLKMCGSHAGVSIGEDGPSQMGLEDMAMMRAIPDAAVLYPSDAVSAERLVKLMADHDGIAYIRTTRPKTTVIYGKDERFELGGLKVLRQSGRDRATLVAAGITVHEALEAYNRLERHRIPVRVIDCYSVKPLNVTALVQAAAETGGLVLTVEDHYAEGGLGEAVASALAPEGVRVHKLAVRGLPRSGDPKALMAWARIDADAIFETVDTLVGDRDDMRAGARPEAQPIGVGATER